MPQGDSTRSPKRPLKLFFCYAHQDAEARAALDRHLDLLEREGLVIVWYDGRITPGSRWSDAIEENLSGSDIVVFLVSQAFFESKYIADVEIELALRLHGEGRVTPVPVLLESVDDYGDTPLAAFETLPGKARPVDAWDDPVLAYDDVVAGIRRAAVTLLERSGGGYDPGPHYFTDAELAALPKAERTRCLTALGRLRGALVDEIPGRRLHENLLVASWSMNKLGRYPMLDESLFFMAQVISAFDVVSLQEVDRNLEGVRELLTILGPEWGYFVTDVTEGRMGNAERFAILHYLPRVAFEHISGDVVLPEEMLMEGRQFARKPLLASFRAADFRFRVCAAHITYGGGSSQPGLLECETLARFLRRVSEREHETVVLAGNFNLREADAPAIRTFREQGVSVPPEILHPTSAHAADRYYSMIGVLQRDDLPAGFGQSGSLRVFEHVYRDEDEAEYRDHVPPRSDGGAGDYKRWRIQELSDHLPLWVELLPPGG